MPKQSFMAQPTGKEEERGRRRNGWTISWNGRERVLLQLKPWPTTTRGGFDWCNGQLCSVPTTKTGYETSE